MEIGFWMPAGWRRQSGRRTESNRDEGKAELSFKRIIPTLCHYHWGTQSKGVTVVDKVVILRPGLR